MKKAFIILLCILVVHTSLAQELKFFTSQGSKEVKQANCSMNDLTVKVPIPAIAATYDKVRFFVFVTPNRAAKSQAIYHVTWNKDDIAGKKEVELVLKSEDGVNEFYYGGYGMINGVSYGSGSALKMDWPCNDEKRTEQIWKISFELEGLKYARHDFNETGVKEPVYNLNTLKKWHDALSYDYGKVDFNFYSEDKTFSIKKVYDYETTFYPMGNEVRIAMGNGIMVINHFPTSKMNIDEVKSDIIKSIKRSTLGSVKSSEEPKESWPMEFCYPCFSKKLKKGGNEEYDKAMEAECANVADWRPEKIGGQDGFVFTTNFGLKSAGYAWNYDSQKPVIPDDGKIKWQSVLVFVVQFKEKVFVGIGYYTETGKSPEYLPKFYKDIVQSFKVY